MTITTGIVASNADLELAVAVDDAVAANAADFDPMSLVEMLPEVSIPVDSVIPGFHLRQSGTDVAHVRMLADAAGSVRLPPVLVQRHTSRIIDGMHRIEAARLRGERTISARLIDCADAEALILAIKSNTLHGLPLSRADRIASAKRVLAMHPDWSDRAVAGVAGLSAKSVVSLRNGPTGDAQFSGKRLGRDGKRRPATTGEGRQRAAEYIKAHPEASLRRVARETDVSVGTVHNVRDRLRRGLYSEPAEAARPGSRTVASGQQTGAVAAQLPSPQVIPVRADARNVQQLTWSAVSAKLTSDPSLRYTEGGRAFLQWMAMHSMRADDWREFVDAIPQRWLRDVSLIAAGMSEEWRLFAEQLRYRQAPLRSGSYLRSNFQRGVKRLTVA
jgi:ParB-like chromosome segregation protein Spo0J